MLPSVEFIGHQVAKAEEPCANLLLCSHYRTAGAKGGLVVVNKLDGVALLKCSHYKWNWDLYKKKNCKPAAFSFSCTEV